MTDQKSDTAKRPVVAVDPSAGTSAEKSVENEGGGNQAPSAPTPSSLTAKVEHTVRTLRVRFTRPGNSS